MKSLIFLFGPPGVGKNFIGNILSEEFGYHRYDTDEDLSSSLKDRLGQGIAASDTERNEFFKRVERKIKQLEPKHPKLVILQAFTKQQHRQHFSVEFADAIWIKVEAPDSVIDQRLMYRSHLLPIALAKKIIASYEPVQISH